MKHTWQHADKTCTVDIVKEGDVQKIYCTVEEGGRESRTAAFEAKRARDFFKECGVELPEDVNLPTKGKK